MNSNGRLDYSDIDDLIKNDEELECYACVLRLDRHTLDKVRLLEPSKGIIKANEKNKAVFYKEGKTGNILKAGINYDGPLSQNADLCVAMDIDEIYKIWDELKEEAFKVISLKEEQVAKKKEQLEMFFKGV